jgi:hypothetical protein
MFMAVNSDLLQKVEIPIKNNAIQANDLKKISFNGVPLV